MKRILTGMAALLAAILFLTYNVKADSAKNSVLYDAQTGRVLQEKSADVRGLIASTTKIMTALVICEQCNVLDRVRVQAEAVGIEGSSMYLREGEILTVQDLLYGLMLSSGNDAAVALAIYCGGTVEGFVQLMNDKARILGMNNTSFENPHGLDSPGHYSTAYDMAVLSAYAMKNPIFSKTVSTKTVNVAGRTLRNHNKLLFSFKGADGIKTGYTRSAGRILVSSAIRQGRRLIAVTMNDPNDWADHTAMLNHGFAQYENTAIISAGEQIGVIEVAGGEAGEASLLAGEDFFYSLSPNEKVAIVFPEPGFVYAPVIEGAQAGYAHILIDGNPVGRFSLVYGETIEQLKDKKRSFWSRVFGGATD